jgi:hypothetical protein
MVKWHINNLLKIFLSKLISSTSEEKNENKVSRIDECFTSNALMNISKKIENDLRTIK